MRSTIKRVFQMKPAARTGIQSRMSSLPVHELALDHPHIEPFTEGRYRVRFAETDADLEAALRLRFEVFNLELNEGLDRARTTGLDEDPFDRVCDHLIVEDRDSGDVIGTYRMQTATMARHGRGFYSAGEFNLAAIDCIIDGAVELGRACIARQHRNRRVLYLLWKGLASYVAAYRKRYLFGCCSISSQDPAVAAGALHHLQRRDAMHGTFKTPVLTRYFTSLPLTDRPCPKLPALFETYLRHGAKVCGGPATDRQFKTIDFLILLDIRDMEERAWKLFFGERPRIFAH